MTRILGIDPGSLVTGYGIIDNRGNHSTHITHGTIRTRGKALPQKLATIFQELGDVVEEYQPAEIAIEQVFMHRNADSALKLGQARGAAITAITVRNIAVYEYTANQVKQATVGTGHAAKQQVQHMVKVLLCLSSVPETDAADALAIALCHAHSREGLQGMAGATGIRGGRLR
ncbi:MAG: crossover junction endodeoxyribonuclease RuvC [Gammaproteobacteria bacterium]|nr:crossover junction endodeoxyribonuclease RuvC [Gammaproteobacteria bacterium]NIQ74836.1 crossover junction endodeoxyribonuclease RuvC [Gammaproteobacteria bacterium]NIR92713.1 crossover junction endodeoxyribonuclease RuvC [Gammaproteobacteria bacterium]NIW47455.1 crossover junction endodeoxyribonuclease RuvC [Gammaproteobacteria bacterium]NIX02155.1 crossover junction endodeoxyribonuclease RuvC [Phycisphaerae bacterium]